MLRIAICDDEVVFRKNIKRYIERYLTYKKIEFEIDTYNSGKSFLGLGIEMVDYSIVFLDINMDEIDGISIAKKIREYSSEVYIVFVTAYIDYSLEGYKVEATRYLLKSNVNFDDLIYECLDTILKKMSYTVQKKKFKFNECEKEVFINRILYVESKLHKLEFHVMENKSAVYTQYSTLNILEKEMQGFNFLRIHQSFLVNLQHIENVKNYKVLLSNKQELGIAKARYKEVKQRFITYKGEV